MTDTSAYSKRQATQEELIDLSNSLRWAYDRGEPLALWLNTGVITYFGSHIAPEQVTLLQNNGMHPNEHRKVMLFKKE